MAKNQWAHLAGRQVFGFPFQTGTPFESTDLPYSTYVLTERDIAVLDRVLKVHGAEPDINEIGQILWTSYGIVGPERYNESWRTIIRQLSSLPQTGTDPETGDDEGDAADVLEQTWQSKAIAAAMDHRDWTTDQIAKHVGKSRSALYADPGVGPALRARNRQKRMHDKSSVRRGHKQDGVTDASVGA